MARRLSKKDNRYLARLVTGERAPCAFCLREVDDELTYGKLYAIGDIQVHYYCCLLSCCLIQKGHDEEGLFGFMYTDILAEIERCKKHKCSYCGRPGANLGCCVGVCRKQFHVPCGRERHAVSQYFGSYKSFCKQHAPRQKIPEHIMAKVRLRAKGIKLAQTDSEDSICLICYEEVDAFPTVHTFWPPCCGKDAWFHRTCLQRMALSAGMHYLKCPLCNDKDTFYEAVVGQGYYVPDRDAAWELEQNAFAEIYDRPATCSMEPCVCPMGREHDADNGSWDIKLCLLCGSAGAHAECIHQSESSNKHQSSNDQSEKNEQQKLHDSNTSTKNKEETSELDQPNIGNSSILMSYLTSEMTNLTTEGSNAKSEVSNVNTEMSNLPIEVLKVHSEMSNNISQEPNSAPSSSILMLYLTSDIANVPPEVSNENSEMSNLPATVPKVNSEMSSVNTDMSSVNTDMSSVNTEISNDISQVSNSVSARDGSLSPEKWNIRFVCKSCLPAAPADLTQLVSCIEAIIQSEQAQAQPATGASQPVMPSRMSIRRTKGHATRPSTSRSHVNRVENRTTDSANLLSSRQELNLRPPRRRVEGDSTLLEREGTTLLSPLKMLELGLREKMLYSGVQDAVFNETVEAFRRRLQRPGPLCQKRKLVDDILQGVFANAKSQIDIKQWTSPNKLYNASQVTNTAQAGGETPKRQEVFDKENLSSINTPNKSPRNFKTETSKSGVKCTDDSMYFNGEVNENIEIFERIQENVENLDNIGKKIEIGELVSCNTAVKVSETEIISNDDLDIAKNDTTNDKHESMSAKNDLNSTRNDKNDTINNSNGIKNESPAIESDLNSTIDDTNDTIDDSESNETPKRLSKARTCKIVFPITSSNKTKQIKTQNRCFGAKEKPKIKSLSLKRANKNEPESESLDDSKLSSESSDTTSISLDITPQNSDITKDSNMTDNAKKLDTTTKESDVATRIDDSTIDSKIIDTLKSRKIDIQQDSSLEISENDQSVKINVIKIEDSPTTKENYKKLQHTLSETPETGFKFNLLNEESSEKKDFIDLESFKKEYLNEVDKEFACNYKHKHENKPIEEKRFKSPIDFALDALCENDTKNSVQKAQKRKLPQGGVVLTFNGDVVKKRKASESDLKILYKDDINETEEKSADDHNKVDTSKSDKRKDKRMHRTKDKRKKKKNKKRSGENKNIEVTINSEKRSSRKREKIKTKLAIKNQNISLKIKLKEGSNSSVSLNIESKNESRKTKRKHIKLKKEKNGHSKFKQYVLQFPEGSSKEVLVKPEKEVCPLKRKYVKQEKSPDKMRQMSIQNFFKIKTEK